MAFHLLERDPDGAREIAASGERRIEKLRSLPALPHVRRGRAVARLRGYRRDQACCASRNARRRGRDRAVRKFRGCYFVLMGISRRSTASSCRIASMR